MGISHECIHCGEEFKTADALIRHAEKVCTHKMAPAASDAGSSGSQTQDEGVEPGPSSYDQLATPVPSSPPTMTYETAVAELVAELIELRDQYRAMGDRIREVEDVLVEAMTIIDLWYVEVPGLGVVKRHSGRKRTEWQHDELFTEVRLLARIPERRAVADMETGEIESEGEAVARMLRSAAHVDYWRLTDLRKLGLDPDQFCRTTPGRPTIEVVAP